MTQLRVDPENITFYENTDNQLQEKIIFWILAAGKNAMVSSKGMENMLNFLKCAHGESPFVAISKFIDDCRYDYQRIKKLGWLLSSYGIGCFKNKARAIIGLMESGINLKTCSRDELLRVWGIGLKTASCFILHSRKDADISGLDVHILSFLRDNGVIAPTQTPIMRNKYMFFEQEFLKRVPKEHTVASFDLLVWNTYRNGGKIILESSCDS
jgi:thermostable 8-oxoguanine DNA glycosylase